MDDAADERDFWGDALQRWPADVVARMGLLPADAEYLTRVGLPRSSEWSLEILPPAPGSRPEELEGLYVLARDGADVGCLVPIAIDPRDGAVYQLEAECGGPERRFVNSSARAYGGFLILYKQYHHAIDGVDDEDEVLRIIDGVEERMRSVDAAAFADEDCYWRIVVQQMRHGMM